MYERTLTDLNMDAVVPGTRLGQLRYIFAFQELSRWSHVTESKASLY